MVNPSNTEVAHWLSHPAHAALRARELLLLESVIPRLFGYHLLNLAHPDFAAWADSSLILHRCRVSPHQMPQPELVTVRAHPEVLPFKSQCIDVLMLTHWLESCAEPKAVLREVARVLLPYGHLVITGVNPWSWVGLKQRLSCCPQHKHTKPVLSSARVLDWLDVLNFQILDMRHFEGAPPASWIGRKLYQLKTLLPMVGTGYLIVAVKKTEGVMPLRPKWSKARKPLWADSMTVPLKKTNTQRD